VTDPNIVGILLFTSLANDSRTYGDCIIAGIFGINLPFLLKPREDGHYEMLCLAYLGNHTLGDDCIENLEPGTDWREAVDHGPLQEFTII
jgi:hypothetical protein